EHVDGTANRMAALWHAPIVSSRLSAPEISGWERRLGRSPARQGMLGLGRPDHDLPQRRQATRQTGKAGARLLKLGDPKKKRDGRLTGPSRDGRFGPKCGRASSSSITTIPSRITSSSTSPPSARAVTSG